jgi:hypothetical protein
LPPFAAQSRRRSRDQISEAYRVLADLSAGGMGRQVERKRGLRVAGNQFIEVFLQKHRQVLIADYLSCQLAAPENNCSIVKPRS